jgi:sorbitol/mannitol transport system substrate-binding protein
VSDPSQSTVADNVGFTIYPHKDGIDNHGNWLWSWNLAIPASSKNADAAKTFIEWATSKEYTELVAAKDGWVNAPPGPRTSLYENQNYLDAAPFADEAKAAMDTADITEPTVEPVPYTGGQFVSIPEFQSIGGTVGQLFAAVVAGQSSVDDALAQAQSATEREMRRAGY